MRKRNFLKVALACAVAGCLAAPENHRPALSATVAYTSAVVVDDMDRSVRPGDDFNRYVNGRWIDRTPLPPGRGSFTEMHRLHDENTALIRDLIVTPRHGASGAAQRVAAVFQSYTDMENRNRLGIRPLKSDLDAILRLESREEVAAFMADPRASGIADMFIWLALDDASRNVLWIDQQAVTQPVVSLNRRRYFPEDEQGRALLRAYAEYIAALLTHAGIDRPRERAEAILALETRLAEGMWTEELLRDRRANWRPMSRAELNDFAPGFPWQSFLDARGVGDVDRLSLATDTSIRHAAAVFAETSIEDWRSYLAFHLINTHRDLLDSAVGDLAFDFYGRTVYGVRERTPLERQGVDFVSRLVSEDVSQLYLEQRFSETQRAEMQNLVGYLLRAMEARLSAAAWMDDETRRAALYKLSNMQVRVGRPSQWSDLSGLDLRSDDPTGNYAQTLQLNWERDRARLGGPLPDDYWFMPAHAADASFSPQMNAILFPAGLLQPPYFDAAADPAANFGAIGAIIGHEIGHGFDDQGSRFSGDGMIEDWWSGQSRAAFDRNAERLIAQYAEFEALPGVRLNSRQMVGENMADLTGVAVAYDAFQAYRRDHPEVPELLDGFTADQRFFMAWARSFRTVWSDEALEREARTSGHAPGQFRINGVVRNLDAWYDAFDVRPNDALYLAPDDRVRIW